MLTMAKVTSGDAAAAYYETEGDYYGEAGHASTGWWGIAARESGLSGLVDTDTFRQLLDGKMPNGQTMHHGGDGKRRAGTDLTFSAPKSVSMQALVAQDHRLVNAHDAAVVQTLAFVERELSSYRVTSDGETTLRRSSNLLVAIHRHDLSRDADPQLHTHAVVLNATLRSDGEWRALDWSAIYLQQKLLGAMYRAALACEITALGYSIRQTHHDGRFELSHISDDHVLAFSSRSRAIVAGLALRGKNRDTASAAEREIAALASRKGKGEIDRTQLLADWRSRGVKLHVDYTPHPLQVRSDTHRQDVVSDAVTFAIEHLTERESVVAHSQILAAAIGKAMGAATFDELTIELAARVRIGELVEQNGVYTTVRAQEVESEILAMSSRGRDKSPPIVSQQWLPGTEANQLNAGQRDAARLILTTGDRVVGVQGRAGTGKTKMLSSVRDAAVVHDWQVVGLAPSAIAREALSAAGIRSETVAACIGRPSQVWTNRTLVLLDEAGMLGASDMRAVLAAVEVANAKLVLIGDTRQLKSVAAGAPFRQLQLAGMATVDMKQILRQKSVRLRTAVELASEGRVRDSLLLLKCRVVEEEYRSQRYARIADDFAALTPAQRADTLVISGTNSARESINGLIRARLGLDGKGLEVRVLRARDLTSAQVKSSLSYRPGNVVKMQRKYASLGLARGALATVLAAGGGHVKLRRDDGENVDWRPALMPHAGAYDVVEREFATGERLRVTANQYASGLVNGEFVTVTEVDATKPSITVQPSKGPAVILGTTEPLHLDHGYCTTDYGTQGKTAARVFIDADASSITAKQDSYYVAISRASESLTIYTDDKELLPEAFSRKVDKSLALDVFDVRVRQPISNLAL